MQQLYCPECGTKAQADQINVQEMVAVCGNCDTVFKFNMPDEQVKAKRRKVKQPIDLEQINDGNDLHMAFRTNWRLDAEQGVILSATMASMGLFMSFIFATDAFAGDVSIPLLVFASALILGGGYNLALRLYNRTHIQMRDDTIMVERKPVPSLLSQARQVSLFDVIAIHCVETDASIENKYDTPRFRVYGETSEGRERIIVNDVVEDYGFYIAQQLQKQLEYGQDVDMSRLADEDNYAEHYVMGDDMHLYGQG